MASRITQEWITRSPTAPKNPSASRFISLWFYVLELSKSRTQKQMFNGEHKRTLLTSCPKSINVNGLSLC